MITQEEINHLIKRYDKLKAERSTLESTWQEIAKFCIPRKSFVKREYTSGQKFDTDVYDSTAMQSVLVLSAGLHSYLTNPTAKWFTIRTQREELMDIQEVKVWIKDCEDRIYDALNASNFNLQIHETYLDLVIFGVACLYEEEDPKDIIRFYTRPVSEIVIAENSQEKIDTLFRYFRLTVRSAYQLWADGLSEETKSSFEKKEYDKPVFFLHIICPRYKFDAKKTDALNMPYASYYIEYQKKHLVKESGYREFPFMIPRFTKEKGKEKDNRL